MMRAAWTGRGVVVLAGGLVLGMAAQGTTTQSAAETRTIVIGHAYADLSAFAEINPAFANGDPEEQALAMVEHWQADGLVPAGVELRLVQRAFDSTDRDDQLAACQALAQEDEADFVVAGFIGSVVAECLATQHDIPVVMTDSGPTELFEASPYLFSLRAAEGRVARSLVAWADDEGILDGRTIGVFYDARSATTLDELTDELESRGHAVASAVESVPSGTGSEQAPIAVQRFQADGVDLVIPMIGTTLLGDFQTFAQEQGYAPDYVDFEYAGHVNDTAALGLVPEQYDGTRALTSNRIGDLGLGLAEPAQTCVEMWESFSGKTYPTEPPETGESTNVLVTCDLLTVFLAALSNAVDAGAELGAAGLVAGLEAVTDLPLAYWDTVAFSADDHTGAETQREVVFDASCQCFNVVGEFAAYPIPPG